ncbi:DUF4160 domain-containing protein [Mucilaginibacter arboris]|uniref:DUF4160 domain-containing protein n=1 Tax=Mucilaginibacter arboris TaxID=2682090 RepID=A0A7K1T0U4_9SPHI|nr:DUF4160 domain-containing protein [Mucilaginibacter arboris]MVN22900.1 DUF4160 domain-containing protein [Mucilaginibacter arboris]
MPKVLEINGYKFSFYSNENDEPAHIHITKNTSNAKYWLEPELLEEYSYGFKLIERRKIKNILREHYNTLIKKWHEHFEN